MLAGWLLASSLWAQTRPGELDSPAVEGPPSPSILSGMIDGANKGIASVQWALGYMYEEGSNGAPKDDAQAAKWYRKSAEQGFKLGEYSLGLSLERARGVTRDYLQAAKWLRLAADQGLPEAKFELAFLYLNGLGVGQNTETALDLLGEAASQGEIRSQSYLGDALRSGLLNGSIPIKKNLDEGLKWTLKSAEQGDASSQFNLGGIYVRGDGVPQDDIEGLAWRILAAAQDVGNAQVTALYVSERDAMESRLGTVATLMAQQRSKQILAAIDTPNRDSDRNSNAPGILDTGSPKASGSGAIVSSGGLVLTAAHVLKDANSVRIFTSKGPKSAKILQIDDTDDIAILQLDKGPYLPLPIANSREVRLGQTVATIGFPNIQIQGFSPKVTKGEISSLNGIGDDPRSWQISVPVQPGNSGGPLLDEHGSLIGIIVSKLSVKASEHLDDIPQNVNYAVKSIYAVALLSPYFSSAGRDSARAEAVLPFEDMVARAQQSVVLIIVY